MIYYDIHTHQPPLHPEDVAIVNCLIPAQGLPLQLMPDHKEIPGQYLSAGIHPWYIYNVKEQLEELESILSRPEVVAVGEAGLDKLAGTSMDIQRELFLNQALLAGKLNKPLLIHCVKAWPELIAAKKALHPLTPWVIHGFRGNGDLASQLIGQGFLLSFGEHSNPAALRAAQGTVFFAETDDKKTDIRLIYEQIATSLQLPLGQISLELEQNVLNTFPLRNNS